MICGIVELKRLPGPNVVSCTISESENKLEEPPHDSDPLQNVIHSSLAHGPTFGPGFMEIGLVGFVKSCLKTNIQKNKPHRKHNKERQ